MMESAITNSKFSLDEFNALKEILHKCGGISYAESCALSHVSKAKEAITVFEQGETRDLLMMLADYSVKRES
jgi:geranylgeranyl pyrophosphate synthase